jgi:Cu/Ag efflux protein CusF
VTKLAGVLALLLWATVALAADPKAAPADYQGTGVVLAVLPPPSELHKTRPVIVIQHEPIHGLMEDRMSMPFIAASTDLFRGLRVGDRIAFGLKDTPDALLVVTIQRLMK